MHRMIEIYHTIRKGWRLEWDLDHHALHHAIKSKIFILNHPAYTPGYTKHIFIEEEYKTQFFMIRTTYPALLSPPPPTLILT